MTILEIKQVPDLPEVTEPYTIDEINSEDVRKLVSDMIDTSKTVGGYGLAAPQIGIAKQLFVYRKAADSDKYTVVFNPVVKIATGKLTSKGEGCLSVKNERRTIKRAKNLTIEAINAEGSNVTIKASNKKEAVILQHELDHLIGKTILNY